MPEILAAGISIGLGTDGSASNNRLDMFHEMDMCAKVHKVKGLDPTAIPAQTVLELATSGSAGILGLEKDIGSLVPEKEADLILVDINQPHLQPFYNSDLLVYAASGADVSTVIINGKIVMQDRKILTFDVLQTMAEVRKLAENL